MADFYALLNKGKMVQPTTINIANNEAFEFEFEYKWDASGLGFVFGNSGNSYSFCVLLQDSFTMQLKGSTLGDPQVDITLSNYDRASYNVFRVVRDTNNQAEVFLNGVSQNTPVTLSGAFVINRLFTRFTAITSDAGMRYFKFFRAGALERHYLSSTNSSSTWTEIANGVNGLIASPLDPVSQHWELYTVAAGTVEFNGNIGNQLIEENASGSFSVADNFSGTGTPFTYSSIGTALPAGFVLNALTGQITYTTAATGTTAGHIIQATAQDASTAQTNSFTIEVSSTASLVPQGVVTITGVTVSEITGNVAWTYNLADATGYEYSLDLSAAVPTLTNPHTIADLTPSTTYSVRVRAINQYGAGAWSNAFEFTTAGSVSLTTGVIKNESLTTLADTLFPAVDVYSQTNGIQVVRFTNVTTSPAGTITLTDAAFQAGAAYRLWYELPNGDWGTEKVVAA